MDHTDKKVKAYLVYPGRSPHDLGCVLVYAGSRNEARLLGWRACPFLEPEYIDFNARREPEFDQWYTGTQVIERNEDLPAGAPLFFDEDV